MNKLINILAEECEKLSLSITEEQLKMFSKYAQLLVEWNKKINLTAITEPREIAVKHFADCVAMLKYVNFEENASIIDVGTGAGFPGIPLAIMRKDVTVTLLDSLNKRIVFLQTVCDELSIDCKFVHIRAEDGGNSLEYREKFDYAVSRAVAPLNILCEYCIPYVKTDGCFIAMKGPNAEQEISNASNAIKLLGGEIKEVDNFFIDSNERNIINILKIAKTDDNYPRSSKKIAKQPL